MRTGILKYRLEEGAITLCAGNSKTLFQHGAMRPNFVANLFKVHEGQSIYVFSRLMDLTMYLNYTAQNVS